MLSGLREIVIKQGKTEFKPREWRLRADLHERDPEFQFKLKNLQEETGLSPITLKVCLSRGLSDPQEIRDYLFPRLESLKSPLEILDMDRAVERLARARKNGERVRVFGDYDVDGTTGAALLGWVFKDFGIKHDIRQPDRFKDGYGLNVKAVEEVAAESIPILVTVDCGITSFDAAFKAKELGIDLIVLDHHQIDPKRGIPEAYAVVDPHRADCKSGLTQLCGCGLAFYLAMALRMKGREEGWFTGGPDGLKEPNLKQHLDLVTIATAADQVPLIGDNRVLVRQGMEVLKQSRKPGVRALLQVAGVSLKSLSPGHLGFVLGPRINASGRLKTASLALDLLLCTDPIEATQKAEEIEQLNKQRTELQNQIWDQVRARVEEGLKFKRFEHAVVVGDSSWHEGVIGIVASRVTETFRRPAVVMSIGESHAKGSVRSFGGLNVLEGLRSCASLLAGFGGHKYAAGLSLKPENFESFVHDFNTAIGEQRKTMKEEEGLGLPLWIEGYCRLEEFTLKTLAELEALAPFGPGNPEPVFAVKAAVQDKRILKGRHLKLNLSAVGHSLSGKEKVIEAIWFHSAHEKQFIDEVGQQVAIEWAGIPELNRFQNRVTPSFRIRDWRRPS